METPSRTRGRPVRAGRWALLLDADRGPRASPPNQSRPLMPPAPLAVNVHCFRRLRGRFALAPAHALRVRAGLVELPDRSIRDRGDLLAPPAEQLESRLVGIRDMPSARTALGLPHRLAISPPKNTRAQSHGMCRGFWARVLESGRPRSGSGRSDLWPLRHLSLPPEGRLRLWARLPSCKRWTISRRGTRRASYHLTAPALVNEFDGSASNQDRHDVTALRSRLRDHRKDKPKGSSAPETL